MMKPVKRARPVLIESRERKRKKGFFNNFQLPDLSDHPAIRFLNKYSLVFHGLLACILVFVIEWVSRHSLSSAVSFCIQSPLTYFYNVLLVFASFLIVYIFKRRTLVRFILSIFWLLLGIINGCVLASRVTPFNFTDLKLVGDLLDMKNSKYFTTGQEIAVFISLAVVIVFTVFLAVKGPKFQGRVRRIRSCVCLGLCLLSIPFITRAAIETNVLAGYFGNLAQGYRDYGFVYSFASSVVDTGMKRPDRYSEETIARINDRTETLETTIDTEDLPNIIFVQLETFIDPCELKFLSFSEDPIPNFRKLMDNYSSGHVTVPVVGAGTANTEFEVLTGMGIRFFGLGEYPYKTVLKDTSCESAAGVLGQLGYGTHALHNNGGNFYGRADIFSQMGFDNFICKELMNITRYNEIGSWPRDEILIGETASALDSTEDQSDFLFTITVQSHGSYPTYQVFEDPAIKVIGGETEEENYQWEYYVNELHEVDAFVGNLIKMLSHRDEKTLVVFYGDHLPTMGLENEDMARGNLFDTAYATWNNFGMEKQDQDMAAYQMMAYFLDRLGIHEGTMFRYHQANMFTGGAGHELYMVTDTDLNRDDSANDTAPGAVKTADSDNNRDGSANDTAPETVKTADSDIGNSRDDRGNDSSRNDRAGDRSSISVNDSDAVSDTDVDAGIDTYLSDWELLQYDLLYGERYSYHGVDKYPASDLVMGVRDVVLKDMEITEEDAALDLYGENFTPWSKVYINQEKIDTCYLDGGHVQVSLADLEDGASVTVNQVGSGNTIFRSSNTQVFDAPENFEELKAAADAARETMKDTREEDLSATSADTESGSQG